MDWVTRQDQILDIVLDFIDEVVPGQRFVVAGFSYGGYLARGMVFRRSVLMDGLLLVAPVILADSTQRTVPSHISLVKDPALIAELEPNVAEAFQRIAVVQSRELLDSIIAVALPAREIADHDFLSKLRENFAFSFDVDTFPEPFGGPTLLMMGRQDSACGYRDAWSILENYPRGTFVVLDRTGHGLMIEQKDSSTH